MGYAKQSAKRYNAESAWSSLGEPKGWQDYYDMRAQAPKYERIYQQLSTIKAPPRTYDWGFDLNSTGPSFIAQAGGPQALIANLFSNINAYPQQVFQGSLAGRYIKLF
jgi:hypothetical protein